MTEYVASLDDLMVEFIERAHRTVWCNMATVDARGRPRSRVVHPVWVGNSGWLGARRSSFKSRHLDANPWVSFAYVADLAQPVYADCRAEWIDDPDGNRLAWEMLSTPPSPAGYDPTPIFIAANDPDFGPLRLTPWRIQLVDAPAVSRVWLQK